MTASEDWGPMRLTTWNCRQGLDAKRHAFDRLASDVVVVPECAAEPALAREPGTSFQWRGDHAPKGLGVFAFNGWTVERLDAPVDLPWVLPVRVRAPDGAQAFDLMAVWTVMRKDGRPGYAGQVAQAFDAWTPAFAAGRTLVAGDFNCSLDGSSVRASPGRLAELALGSGYHAFTAEEHGAESAITLRWVGRGGVPAGFHCDYVLVPERLLPRVVHVAVGDAAEWIDGGLSDHAPVSVDFGAPAHHA